MNQRGENPQQIYLDKAREERTKSAILLMHSPLAVTSPMFSRRAKALYMGALVDDEVTAATF